MDSRIYAAIITSIMALAISIINAIVYRKNRQKDEDLQFKRMKELEQQKYSHQLDLLQEKEMSTKQIEETKSKQDYQKEFLKNLQKIKDSIYKVQKSNDNDYIDALDNVGKSMDSFITTFQGNYMEMDMLEGSWMHDLKNEFHDCYSILEIGKHQVNKKDGKKNLIAELNRTLKNISHYQNWYKNYTSL